MIDWLSSAWRGSPVQTYFKQLPPWDVPRAEREIGLFMRLAANYGPTLHIDSIVVGKQMPSGLAYGIAVHPGESFVSFAIALNGTQHCFKSWSGKHRLVRLMWLLGAYFTTLGANERFRAGMAPEFSFIPTASPEATLIRLNALARCEYRVQKQVDRVFRDNFTESNGIAVRLFNVFERSGRDPHADITDAAEKLPAVIRRLVRPVVEGKTRDSGAAWEEIAWIVYSVIATLSRYAGIFDETPGWAERTDLLSRHNLFAEVFQPAWDVIAADCVEFADADWVGITSPSPMVLSSLKDLFRRIGVRILDEPQGLRTFDLEMVPWAA